MRFAKLNSLLLGACFILSSCQHLNFTAEPEPLPELPLELRICFNEIYPLPRDKQWSKEKTAEVIGELRKSELAKTSCGRRLIAFYDDLASGLENK